MVPMLVSRLSLEVKHLSDFADTSEQIHLHLIAMHVLDFERQNTRGGSELVRVSGEKLALS